MIEGLVGVFYKDCVVMHQTYDGARSLHHEAQIMEPYQCHMAVKRPTRIVWVGVCPKPVESFLGRGLWFGTIQHVPKLPAISHDVEVCTHAQHKRGSR